MVTTARFALDAIELLEGTEPPADFETVVSMKGDRFRDAFTRSCLYLVGRHPIDADPSATTVVVGTEYGNLDAMLRLQRQAHAGEKRISAQQFPHSTTSSASVFVNQERGITGGNVTLNAGALNPVLTLLHALLHVSACPEAAGHVLVGDTYCAEAFDDLRKNHGGDRHASPAVLWAGVRSGDRYTAEFRFDGDRASEVDDLVTDDGDELNPAFPAYAFLCAVVALDVGHRVALRLSRDGRSAEVVVGRTG